MAICLDGEQRRECVAFRPRVISRPVFRPEMLPPTRCVLSNQFPDSESPVCMMLLLNSNLYASLAQRKSSLTIWPALSAA